MGNDGDDDDDEEEDEEEEGDLTGVNCHDSINSSHLRQYSSTEAAPPEINSSCSSNTGGGAPLGFVDGVSSAIVAFSDDVLNNNQNDPKQSGV